MNARVMRGLDRVLAVLEGSGPLPGSRPRRGVGAERHEPEDWVAEELGLAWRQRGRGIRRGAASPELP